MNKRTNLAATVTTLVIGAAEGGGVALAAGHDDDTPITGPDLGLATDAALAAAGEGRVTETEVDDEDGYFEVELTLDDGSEVEVYLDANFKAIGPVVANDDVNDDTNDDATDTSDD